MKISAFALSERGIELGLMLQNKTDGKIGLFHGNEDDLKKWLHTNYLSFEALIIIGSIDTVILAISPYISTTEAIPTVVVVDELGKFAIPIISGLHVKSDDLAKIIADSMGCIPVITSLHSFNVFSIESWARSVGLKIANPNVIKNITLKLLNGESVYFESVFPVFGEMPNGILPSNPGDNIDFSITYLSSVPEGTLHLVPPVLTLGIEIEKNTSCEAIQDAFLNFMNECGCHALALTEVCSIDSNAHEKGLIEFCYNNNLPFRTFSAEDISRAVGRFSAPVFEDKPGCMGNVCERCAVLSNSDSLFVRKSNYNGIYFALAIKEPH